MGLVQHMGCSTVAGIESHQGLSGTGYIATIDLVYNYGQWELHFSYR